MASAHAKGSIENGYIIENKAIQVQNNLNITLKISLSLSIYPVFLVLLLLCFLLSNFDLKKQQHNNWYAYFPEIFKLKNSIDYVYVIWSMCIYWLLVNVKN